MCTKGRPVLTRAKGGGCFRAVCAPPVQARAQTDSVSVAHRHLLGTALTLETYSITQRRKGREGGQVWFVTLEP